MLFFGGIILDKMGVRFTGVMSCIFMFVGAAIKWYAISHTFGDATVFGFPAQVALAAFGFAVFGMGAEITGITVSKVIVKWFTGHELALAMGLQVAMARIGTAAALACSLPIANAMGDISAPILFGAICLCIGLIAYIVYCVMDRKLDQSVQTTENAEKEEGFQMSDLKQIFTNKGFWLITILCLMFYAGVFPFLKFATKLMIYKYHVEPQLAGMIPAMGCHTDDYRFTDAHRCACTFRPADPERMVVCHHRDDSAGYCLLIGTVGHVAFRSEDHSDETVRFCLCHHLLHSEYRSVHGSGTDRLGYREVCHHPDSRGRYL